MWNEIDSRLVCVEGQLSFIYWIALRTYIRNVFLVVLLPMCIGFRMFTAQSTYHDLDHPEVLLVGDSIMYHVRRYPGITQDRKICNMCVPGQRSQELLDELEFINLGGKKLIPAGHPYQQKLVGKIIVHIGTNDLQGDLHAESICDRLIQIVNLVQRHIRESSPDGSKSVHLLGLLPRQNKKDPVRFGEMIKDINSRLKNHFHGQGVFINPPKCLANKDGSIVDEFYHTDKLHLSELGLEEILKCMFRFIDSPFRYLIKRSRRLRRIRLGLPRLAWCDNRKWSDWSF